MRPLPCPTRAVMTLLVCLALAACDDATPDDPITLIDGDAPDMASLDMAPSDMAPADAAPDMPPADMAPDMAPCGPACATLTWREAPPLPRVSDHHTTFIAADDTAAALFVVGGIESDTQGGAAAVSDRIDRAPIGPDGLTGAFTDDRRLPAPLAFHAQARDDRHVWLAGGITRALGAPTASRTVYHLTLGPGATLEGITDCGALPAATIHPTAELLDGRLHVIGGSTDAPLDTVWVAAIEPDGCPGPFAAAPPLPETRSHHASAVIDGRIHLFGGFGPNQTPRRTILRSTHDATGALTGWEPAGELDPAPWTAAALVLDDTVWLLGGGEGSGVTARFVDKVRRAVITDGTIGPFEAVTDPLPLGRSHVHQTPAHAGHVYSVGGRVFTGAGFDLGSIDRVFVGRLQAP